MLTFTSVARHLTENRQAELAQTFAALKWVPFEAGIKVPYMAGQLIRAALERLPGRALTHFAISPELAPFGLVAIRRDGFKGGPVNIYLADCGDESLVLATEQIAA